MAELVDASDLGPDFGRSGGSSPFLGKTLLYFLLTLFTLCKFGSLTIASSSTMFSASNKELKPIRNMGKETIYFLSGILLPG